ncbi:hypothetical protein BKA60DRAFT_583035 [Fusarium oxysporum]|nr:hypothetical protein BKA60DRAFT_583035 [Fusarium oxysporum]
MSVNSFLSTGASSSLDDSEYFFYPTLPSDENVNHWRELSTSTDTFNSYGDPDQQSGTPFCVGCEEEHGDKYCTTCDQILCRTCCDALPVHRGLQPRHPMVLCQEYELFRHIVNPQETNKQQQDEDDFLSLWFAVSKEDNKKLHLRQYPRFSDLVKAHRESFQHRTCCYAQLVSFIGGTGSGKSTLIRVLMKQPWDAVHLNAAEDASTSLPIIGRADSTSATTGDVHLYAAPKIDASSPSTFSLFVDCEGFDGGSQPPLTIKAKRYVLSKFKAVIDTKTTDSLAWAKRMLGFLRKINVFPLELEGSREDAVEKLFPRLLYNFSDVVVYVMPSSISRSMEHVIIKILETAENSRKTAVNRVILPHLIVVLNMSPSDIPDWDPSVTTGAILNEQSSALESNEVIRTYCRNLNQLRNDPIRTVRDLLDDCYSSIQFIRLPDAGNQRLFSQQVQMLDWLIRQATEQARRTKDEAHCLLETETQDRMFKMAFEHYKSGFEAPFDFLESLLATNPLDTGLSSTMFALLKAAMVAYQSTGTQLSGQGFCSLITPVICSFVALDSCRSHRRHHGRMRDIYRGGTLTSLMGEAEGSSSTYQTQVRDAIDQFLDFACPCDFVYEGKRCVNYRRTHAIHQDKSGQVIKLGTFQSTFVDECWKRWNDIIEECLDELDVDDRSSDNTGESNDDMRLWSVHSRNLQKLYDNISQLDVTEIEACSWCFRDNWLESLACGHRVCWKCAQMIGDLLQETTECGQQIVCIKECGLHNPPSHFRKPHYVNEDRPGNAVVLSTKRRKDRGV